MCVLSNLHLCGGERHILRISTVFTMKRQAMARSAAAGTSGSAFSASARSLRPGPPRTSSRRRQRSYTSPSRRLGGLVTVPSLLGSALVPVAVVSAGVAAAAAEAVVSASPAKASLSGSVLILSTSVNGGMSSAEATQATALGLTVTVDSTSAWGALSQSGFAGYSAVVIGDPSSGGSCSSSVPSAALSSAGTWGPAVTGNVAVIGTAPALAGGTALIRDAIAYAASGSGTGLYVSLNCEYSSQPAGTPVSLLADVEGGGFTVTGQQSGCPSATGTVNTWQA